MQISCNAVQQQLGKIFFSLETNAEISLLPDVKEYKTKQSKS